MCDFQSLYVNDDGYIVCCRHCHRYQLAYGTTLLNLCDLDFEAFRKMVAAKCNEEDFSSSQDAKSIFITTPSQGVCMLLTGKEASRFNDILEEADNEIKAQALISLFNE